MTRTLLLAAATLVAGIATPALADTAPQHTFTRDGDTYVYTMQQVANRTVISGRVLNTGDTFRFNVRGTHVTGYAGSREVAFDMPASSVTSLVASAN